MYALFRSLVVALLKCPAAPPEPPAGSHESVQIFRAAPAFLRYRLLHVWIGLFFAGLAEAAGIVALIVHLGGALGVLVAALVLVVVLVKIFTVYALARLDYEMRYYIVTDRSLRVREGVVVVRETTITFANIQNMRIDQGPLQRLFGIYDLVVETAGGGTGGAPSAKGEAAPAMHQGIFRGIGRPAELRDLILAYQRQVRSSGLGDHDDTVMATWFVELAIRYALDLLAAAPTEEIVTLEDLGIPRYRISPDLDAADRIGRIDGWDDPEFGGGWRSRDDD